MKTGEQEVYTNWPEGEGKHLTVSQNVVIRCRGCVPFSNLRRRGALGKQEMTAAAAVVMVGCCGVRERGVAGKVRTVGRRHPIGWRRGGCLGDV